MSLRSRQAASLLIGAMAIAPAASGCRRPPAPAAAIRLVDVFDAKLVEGSSGTGAVSIARTEWRFDGPPPRPASPPGPPGPAGPAGSPAPASFAATRGWEAGPGVAGLAIRDGLLVGRTTSQVPIIHLERTTGLENADLLHSIEVRLRVSGGANMAVATRPSPTVNLAREPDLVRVFPWTVSPVIAGQQVQTYTLTPSPSVSGSRVRHILIRPTDAAGAEFAIESVRLVFRREHLAGVPSGVSWQGLRDVYRETLVTRSPETVRFNVTLPSRPAFHVAIGTPEDAPVTFRLSVRQGNEEAIVMTRTVTTPHRWERRVVDLGDFAGRSVGLSLSAVSERPGTLALWGAPAVRQRQEAASGGALRTVILIQGDTLRADHLDAYGYGRPTAPALRRLAEEGALFRHAITQTGWTKAATPAVLTSLYPSTHGVHQIPDRLPASATTIAEAFREGGFATVSFSSVRFTGHYTNLHQGFEELHESESLVGRAGPGGSKTAREFVDRLVEWLEDHRDVPSFAFLHVFDPHSPYEPHRPYDTMWADPKWRDEYLRQQEVLKKFIANPFLADRGMATKEELVRAGLDPAAFIRFSKDWYDGSIRGMDAEIGRLVERLQELGLRDRALVAFYADHGEEFHEHGRMWHGQNLYGEMIRVPLILWGPGVVPKGLKVEEPVALLDVMPTLLDAAGLPVPPAAQGQSLRPLLASGGGPGGVASAARGFSRRPVVSEKQPSGTALEDDQNASECYAIVAGGWKLIHNVARPPGKPEFELYDFLKDPLDQHDVAAQHPDVVARLARTLEGWRKMSREARLKPDSEAAQSLTAEQLERLRSLGYVR